MPTSTTDTTQDQPSTDLTTTTADQPVPTGATVDQPPELPLPEIKTGDWVAVKDQTKLGWDWHGNVKSEPSPEKANILWKEFDVVEIEYNKDELVPISAPA